MPAPLGERQRIVGIPGDTVHPRQARHEQPRVRAGLHSTRCTPSSRRAARQGGRVFARRAGEAASAAPAPRAALPRRAARGAGGCAVPYLNFDRSIESAIAW